MNPKLDESEYRALVAELKSKTQAMRATLFELTGETLEAPTCNEREDYIAAKIALQEHYDALKSKLSGKAPATVTESANLTHRVQAHKSQASDTKQVNENQRQASANAQPKTEGVSHTLVGEIDGKPVSLQMKPIKAKTLTDQVIEKRGCKDMAELNRRYVSGEFSNPQD